MSVAELTAQLADLNRKADAQADLLRTGMARRNTGARPWSGPDAAHYPGVGDNVMGSKGFSFSKLLLYKANKIRREEAKLEDEFCERLMTKMAAQGFRGEHSSSVLAPIWPDGFDNSTLEEGMYREMKSMLTASVADADPDEMDYLAHKHFGRKSAVTPALSWIDQTVGGTFVGPATFGAPIELLRANEVLMQAGASVVPLGPSGKITYPRLTAATTGAVSGENTQQTPVRPATGSLNLSAKKVISVVVLPGELMRFGSPAVEALVRNDMFKTVSLIADYKFLHGAGSDLEPLGLATMGAAAGNPYGVGIVTPNASNQMAAQDLYSFPSVIEAANGTMTAYLMRPEMKWAIRKSRWSPDGTNPTGGFLFCFTRDTQDRMVLNIEGMQVVASTQISKTRDATTHTWVGGINGPDYLIGMFGAIEFTQSDQGWTLLSSDQVAVRAILHCDGGMRHPAQFAFCDSVNLSISD